MTKSSRARVASPWCTAVLACLWMACGWSDPESPSVTVPDVRGMLLQNAEAAITDVGLVVGEGTQEHSETVPAGRVIRQLPLEGTSVVRGTAVNLVHSLGLDLVTVPDVVGTPRGEAELEIVGAGLVVGEVIEEYSETVATGHVIQQSPTAGATALRGSAVALVQSLGEPWILDSPYAFGAYQHKVQLHVHTTDSDGAHSRQWVMQAYENLGYAAVAITDHDHSTHSPRLTDPGGHGIIHIPGVEYSGDNANRSWNHMLGIHIQTIYHDEGKGARQAQIDQAELEGGLTYLCHPYDESIHRRGWNDNEILSVEDFTGIEIHNGGSYNTPGGRDYAFKVDFALVNGKTINVIAVDDFHTNASTTMDRGYVVINSDVSAEDLQLSHVVAALRGGNHFAAGRLKTGHPAPPHFTRISVDGLLLTAETDKVSDIEFITMRHNYYLEGVSYSHKDYGVTLAEYPASPDDGFVRIKATYTEDGQVSYAWSNPIYVLPVW